MTHVSRNREEERPRSTARRSGTVRAYGTPLRTPQTSVHLWICERFTDADDFPPTAQKPRQQENVLTARHTRAATLSAHTRVIETQPASSVGVQVCKHQSDDVLDLMTPDQSCCWLLQHPVPLWRETFDTN